jgi:hypothetical protein
MLSAGRVGGQMPNLHKDLAKAKTQAKKDAIQGAQGTQLHST